MRGRRGLEQALAIREAVFVREQGFAPTEEEDAWDAGATHFLMEHEGRPVGTARLYALEPGRARLGRVAVVAGSRGKGWGAHLIRQVLAHARALGCSEVLLRAQVGSRGFYHRLGFAATGEPCLEAGMPHLEMRWTDTPWREHEHRG